MADIDSATNNCSSVFMCQCVIHIWQRNIIQNTKMKSYAHFGKQIEMDVYTHKQTTEMTSKIKKSLREMYRMYSKSYKIENHLNSFRRMCVCVCIELHKITKSAEKRKYTKKIEIKSVYLSQGRSNDFEVFACAESIKIGKITNEQKHKHTHQEERERKRGKKHIVM